MITLEELHKSAQDLDMVGAWLAIQRDLLQRLSTPPPLGEALELCLEAATQAARMDRARLYAFDGPGGGLKLVAHKNLPADLLEAVKLLPADSPIAQGLNITAPIYQPHVYTQGDLTVGDAELRSAAIVPVFYQTQRVAMLHIGTTHNDQVQKFAPIPLETIAQIIAGLLGQFQTRAELKNLKSHAQTQLEQTRSLADTILEQTDAFAHTQLQQLTAQFTEALTELKSRHQTELTGLRQELTTRQIAKADRHIEPQTIAIQTQAALKQLENNARDRLETLHRTSDETLAQSHAAMQSRLQDVQSQLALMLIDVKTDAEAELRRLAQQARENRAHHEAKYQHLLNTVSDWVWAVDTEGNFTASNPAVMPLLGYQPEQVVGQPMFDFIHPGDRSRIQAIFVQTMMGQAAEKQSGWADMPVSWVHQEGAIQASRSTLFPLFDPQGYLTGFQGIDRMTVESMPADATLNLQLKAVSATIAQISPTAEVGGLLKEVMITLQSELELYHAQIYLPDSTGQMLIMRACAGPAADFLQHDTQPVSLNQDRNFISQVARNNEALLRNEAGLGGDISGHPLLPDTRSRLVLPLAMGRQVVGVLDLHHATAHYFGPDNIDLFELLAAWLAAMLTVVDLRQPRPTDQQRIETQQAALKNLPTPIIPVLDQIIAVPLVGHIDAARGRAIVQAVLAGVKRHAARVVVFDLSGLSAAGDDFSSHLHELVQAVQAQGVQTIITGGQDS